MLNHQKRYACSPFLHHVEEGYLIPYPHLRYGLVKYDIAHYRDNFFTQYAISPPGDTGLVAIKRRAEYLAVRYATQRLLRAWDCYDNVCSAPNRAPVWPAGFCGSLSHTSECVIAVIAPAVGITIPGVDIEELSQPDIKEIADTFTTRQERDYLLSIENIDIETLLVIVFSAKESLYKSLYPEVGFFFDFDVACLCEINSQEQMFTLMLTQRLSPDYVAGSLISGYLRYAGEKCNHCYWLINKRKPIAGTR